MSNNLRVMVISLIPIALTLCVASWYLGDHDAEEFLKVSENDLELGTVWAQSDLRHEMAIQNTGSSDIVLSKLMGSCNCVEIVPDRLTIPGGQTRTIQLTLDISPVNISDPLDVQRSLNVVIAAVTGDPPKSVKWKLRGRVSNILRLASSDVFFDEKSNICTGEHRFRPIAVRYEAAIPIQRLAVASSTDVRIEVHKENDKEGWLEVEPKGGLAVGAFERKVNLIPIGIDGNCLPSVEFSIGGISVRDVSAVPDMVFLGLLQVGGRGSCQLSLGSRSKSKFAVSGIRVEGAGIAVRPAELSLPERKTYELVQRAVADGPQRNMVVFAAVTNQGERFEVRVPVTYVGVAK